jgi:L-iditol 2-dehydrogenase
MPETMKAAVLHGINDVRIEQLPVPQIAHDDDVLVRIRSVGVCGSDIHYFREGRIGRCVVEGPMILGHECAGEIAQVGPAVRSLRPGDRVAVEPGVPCRKCEFCRTGTYNLCPDVVFLATPPVDGAFCEFIVSPADFVFPIPDAMSFQEGAMIEPLSVGMYATQRGGVGLGDTVVVLGAGPIGLTTLQAAKARGATTIIATDLQPIRVEAARRLGATHALNAAQTDVAEVVAEVTGGRGADVVFECAGAAPTIQMSLRLARNGGRVILVGLPSVSDIPLSVPDLIQRELDVGGLFRYANVYPDAIAAVGAGLIDVRALITHSFTLDQTQEALIFADEHKDEALKVCVDL